MNILQYLLSFLSNPQFSALIGNILGGLFNGNTTSTSNGGFNLESIFNALEGFLQNKKSPLDNSQKQFLLSPISSFADREIIDSLNRYFGA